MKKLFLTIAIALLISANANATITSSTDNSGKIWYYSSYPMPNAKWKTKIASKSLSSWQFIVAAPFYYYGNGINSDIIKLEAYFRSNGTSFREGVCTSFPYTTPCLR